MRIYIVQKGDTLFEIARENNMTLEEIMNVNPQLSNPDVIMPGMKIKIPVKTKEIKKDERVASEVKSEKELRAKTNERPMGDTIATEKERKHDRNDNLGSYRKMPVLNKERRKDRQSERVGQVQNDRAGKVQSERDQYMSDERYMDGQMYNSYYHKPYMPRYPMEARESFQSPYRIPFPPVQQARYAPCPCPCCYFWSMYQPQMYDERRSYYRGQK